VEIVSRSVAPVVEVIEPQRQGGTWQVAVRCPHCRRRHVHGVQGPGGPLLLSREGDCGQGDYVIGPLPAGFDERVRAHEAAR